MKMLKRISKFFQEVAAEFKKVSWSSRDELITSTGVVIVSVFLLSLFIAICDFLFSRAISVIIR